MSSINLKIDEERNVIQSYYNGKWNDLSNRNIDTKLYPIILTSTAGLDIDTFTNKYRDAEGNFKHEGIGNSEHVAYPINPSSGVVFRGTVPNSYDLIIPSEILRLVPSAPAGIFTSTPIQNTTTFNVKCIEEPASRLMCIYGTFRGGVNRPYSIFGFTLPSKGQTLFPDYDPDGYVTIIHLEPR